MSNGNSNLPQTTDELRQSVLDGVRGIYSRRYEEAKPQPEQEERPSLSSYSQDIQDLLSGNAVRDEYRSTQRQAMEKLLADNDIDAKSFFEEKPDATVVDVMRKTNFEGFADKERAYSTGHSTDYGRERALSQIQEQFSNRFDNSLVFPDLGVKINEYIPASIREDDRQRADFEKAFYQETGIALDFDGSDRVGDMYVEGAGIGNAFREAGYLINDLGVGIMDATLGTAEFFYDILGGDINEANEEFLEKQAAGEISTQLEAAEGSMSKGAMDLFWASFTSSEARRQLIESQKSRRTIDFQAMQDRNQFDTDIVVGNSVDMLIESAPLLLDLAVGSHGGSLLMKGATKAVAKQAAKKVGTRAVGKATRFVDPKTGRFISKEAAQKVINSSNTVQRLINQGGAVVVSDLLVASQMHSDNVGQEWYDNLSGSERASYLAQQSTAEVLSGMVLNNVLGRGFFGKTSKSKVTQEGWKARKKFVTEYGKNIANSTFLGISEEALAEAGTAAWQYISEVDARVAGGDVGARFDINELDRRVKDAAAAGLMMGGLAGFAGGVVGGAARAYMASFHQSNIEGKKAIEKLAQAVTEASNATDRQKAMERLQAEVKKRSGAQSALSRAYFRMSEANPEVFEKVARLQGQINTLVHQHKSTSDPEVQGALFQEVKTLIEEKQKLENEAFEGDTTFEDVYKEEAEAVAKERGGKVKGWKGKYDSDSERLAEQAVQQGIQNQIESLEAAQAVNSPEQNADDDTQDQQGETEGDAQAKREAAEDNSVEGDGDNQFAPSIDEDAEVDDRVKSKYRDVIGTVNNLMRGFKRFGIKVVLHKTSDSYFKATGKTGRGVFHRDKSNKTIHMDLEKMATGAEAEGLEGVYDTPTHEFLHLAFTTADVATLKRYKAELLGLARRVGLEAEAKEIFAAVQTAYEGKPEGDMINEQVTNALERLINALPEAKKPGFIEGALRAFLRVFGLEKAIMGEQITPTDFLNFIKEFKQARDEGAEFKREEIPAEGAAETESRDINIVVRDAAEAKRIGDRISDRLGIENIDDYPGDPNLKSQAGKHYLVFTPEGINTFSKEDIQRIQKEAELVTRRKMKVGKSSPQEMSTRRPRSADMESRDLGMRQPSRAYPDLINKVVNYRVYYLDKIGGQQSYQTNGLRFNDYWHFRNWYLRETGNGKMANNIGGFTYTGDDGTIKKINPPKPKRDRETGEIIDMEPRLRTPQQRKIEKAESAMDRRKRYLRYAGIRKNAGAALKFAVGKIRKIEKTGELAFYNENMLLEQDSQSELPVAYSETFFTEGLNVDELDQLGRDFGDNLEFLIPTTQEADFAFTVRNNGDGTVTIDAHSNVKPEANPNDLQEGSSLSGPIELESVDLERVPPKASKSFLQTLFDVLGRKIPVMKLVEYNGGEVVVVFYDPTSGERSGVGADFSNGVLYSQYDEDSANQTLLDIEKAAIRDHEKRLKSGKYEDAGREVDADGNVSYSGYIVLATGFMSSDSLYGNTDVIAEAINTYQNWHKKLVNEVGKEVADDIVVQAFSSFYRGLNEKQQSLVASASKEFDLISDTSNFKSSRMSQGSLKRVAIPTTAEGVFKLMDSVRDSRSVGFRDRGAMIKKMFTNSKKTPGLSDLLLRQLDSRGDEFGGIDSREVPRTAELSKAIKNKGIIVEENRLSQTIPYYKAFKYRLSEEVDSTGKKVLTLSNTEVRRKERVEGELEVSFPFEIKSTGEGDLEFEFASEELIDFETLLKNYKFKVPKAKFKSETIGGISEELDNKVSEAKDSLTDWDKKNATKETKALEIEIETLKKTTKNKKASEREKTSAERKLKAILNPKTRNDLYRKAQEREAIKSTIEEAQRERSNFKSSVATLQSSVTTGEVDLVDTDNSTRTQESIDLGVGPDNESNLPFEPNRLNGFQAFMARVDQLFANKYANVFSLQRAIEGAKKAVVDISQDFINAETLMYGKTANDLEKLDEKVKVISQEMKDAGLIGEDVSQFLIARHAEERNALIAERTDGETLNGSGMSNERAQEVMDSFSPERKAALESIAKKVDAITKDTRQTMVKFGLESQETIDAFEEMFDNYVPLGGLSADEMSADTSLYPTGGAGMSIYGDTTRRAKGRASEANNVLAQAIAQNAAVHAKARKNEALSSLYNLVESNPNAKVWRISSEVPFDAQSAVGVRVNGEQKFIVFTNPDHAKALKNMGVEKLDLFSKIMRSFSGFLRRSFTTANPEFIISNFARDIQSALFNAMAEADIPGGQIQSKYIATKIIERVKQTLPALLKGAVGKDLDPEMAAYFEEFKEDGGQTGWGFVKDVGTIAAEIEAEVNEKNRAQKAREWMMKNSIDVVENVNDAFENSIRLAAYMEARKAGTSREKAAELAKNITVNFNRSGELGAVANAWYMFFNASVQGTVRLARSLGTLKDVRKPNGELESWHNRLNAAQKMAFGLSLTTGMLTAINLAMSDEDEDGVLFYNKIPDYEKERNLIIMYDGQNYLKIPLPYGFNVFANMGSAMAEVAGGQRDMTDAGMFLLNSAFSSFSPVSFGQSKDAAKYLAKGATPTIFKPLVDIAVNESYFGSSVYKEQFPVGAPKPEAEMSFRSPEGVRKFFQWMNEATGGSEFVPGKADFNPDKFWYGFEYYIGGAGQFVTRTLGTGRDAYEMIKEGEKVPMKSNDFPFLRKLYGEFSKYYDSDVYVENANTVSQLYKERKEADNKNDKRYRGIMKLESSRKRTEKQIKRLRELRKEARDIKNYVERQNRIYELYEKERSLLMQFNKQFEQLRGQD